jgi:hypothetical protein
MSVQARIAPSSPSGVFKAASPRQMKVERHVEVALIVSPYTFPIESKFEFQNLHSVRLHALRPGDVKVKMKVEVTFIDRGMLREVHQASNGRSRYRVAIHVISGRDRVDVPVVAAAIRRH